MMKAGTTPGLSLALGALAFLTITIGRAAGELRSTLSYTMGEEVPVGTLIGEVARDAGLEDVYGAEVFPTLQLSVVDQGLGYTRLFRFSAGGDLETATRIDRDALCPAEATCVINLDVQVAPRAYFHIIKVTLEITDQNDNAPHFARNPVGWAVNEGPQAVGEFTSLNTAVDNDSPRFGVQRYSLNDTSGKFELRVQNASGTVDIYLYLQGQLDRESKDRYSVQVIAYDGGSPAKRGVLRVDINVTDINDNKPTFSEDSYSVSVSESLPAGSTILRVSATDNDIGPNGRIVYSLAAKSQETHGGLFAINNTTGDITIVERLDHEEETAYILTLVATNVDPTTNSMSSLAKVQVNVMDANDNPPIIKVHGTTTDTVLLSEGASIGDFVAHITVHDPDAGANGKFSCSLNNNFFRLENLFDTDFKIVTSVKLDREAKNRYELDLTCRDQGAEARDARRRITVEVADENDNAPRFAQASYGSSILENNNRGVFITRVQAADRDAGRNGMVRYRFLDDAHVGELLSLDSVSGNVTARVSFDHETTRRVEFKVVASDLGEAPNTATVAVVLEVMDVDDEKPEFSKPEYEMFVYEGAPIKSMVGGVSAEDRDSEPFNKFKFSLDYAEADANSFTIEPETGSIYTSEVLDREAKATYTFVVRATSLGLRPVTSTAAVAVFVADKNDEDPIISFPTMYNNTVYMSNRAEIGEVVSRVRAHDSDATGDNSRLSYVFISGNDDHCFGIDEQTGAVTVERDLGYISHQLFGLVVAVRDHGSPPRAAESFLNVIVNRSIGHTDSSLMSNQNLTIVVTIAAVSGVLMVVLIIAIVVLLRWPWLASRKYNYVARLALRKNSNGGDQKRADKMAAAAAAADVERQEHHQVKETNLRPDLDSGDQKFFAAKGLSFTNVNFNDETDGRCKQISPANNRSCNAYGIPEGHEAFSQRQPIGGSQRAQTSRHPSHQPHHPPIPTVSGGMARPASEKDSDSACSADMSNATDSGRGSTGHEEPDNDVFSHKHTDRSHLAPRNDWNQGGGRQTPMGAGPMSSGLPSPGLLPGDKAARYPGNNNNNRASGRRRPPPPPPADYGLADTTHSAAVRATHNGALPGDQTQGPNSIYLAMTGNNLHDLYPGDAVHGRGTSSANSTGGPRKNISNEIHV